MVLALATPQFTMSQGHPRTQATRCDALYYGLARTPDPAAAYRCYGAAEATQAVETLLTVERVDELRHNILGIH